MNKRTRIGFATILPILALSGPTFAYWVPNSVSTPVAGPVRVLQPLTHGMPASTAGMPVVGPGVANPPTSFPLTLTQLQQTIAVVDNELTQAPNGTVSVSPLGWQQSGLTGPEIAWAQQAITHYDQQINAGQLQPVLGSTGLSIARQPLSNGIMIRSFGTYGMDYDWFIARTPYWYTEYFWWGTSQMANNSATKNLVNNMTAIATGTGIASLFTWEGSWLIGLSGLVIGAYANIINNTNNQGGNFGVHINFVYTNPIPVGIYANVP
ncbi:hypothetical protein BXT84_00885 [Sulfobacillus thermotolerans]|uniref:Uncharacterized protein n=1 Tax=Sulfobacillus thermotolerans TaxID=338644 RepID=A0ABN5GZV7_9FIRM|nr:hypothetical protein BXT84_00885 [Sulfobacillus thermotolerans]